MRQKNHKNLQNLRLHHKWRSLFGDFFHSKFLGSRKTAVHLRIKKRSLKVFPDNQKGKKAQAFFLAKLLLGIFAIILLILLIVKLYGLVTDSTEKNQAKRTLLQIKEAMNSAKTEADGTSRYIVLAPRSWHLLSSRNRESLKDFCKDGNCLCMCPEKDNLEKDLLKCIGQGVCETQEAKVFNTRGDDLEFTVDKVPYALTIKYMKEENIFRFYHTDLFSFNKEKFISEREFTGGYFTEEGYSHRDYNEPSQLKSIATNEHLNLEDQFYNDFLGVVIKESNSKYINPFIAIAILKEKHNVSEVFKQGTDYQKITAAFEVRKSVFNRAQELLTAEDYNEVCQFQYTGWDSNNAAENKKMFEKVTVATTRCLAGALQKAYNDATSRIIEHKYIALKLNPLRYELIRQQTTFTNQESATISWYSGNEETTKKIWETFQIYIR